MSQSVPTGPFAAPAAPPRSGAGAVAAAVLTGCWAVGITVVLSAGGWGFVQLLASTGARVPGWVAPALGWVDAILVAGPAALLAAIPRSAAVRAAGRLWLAGALLLAVLGTVRAVPVSDNWAYLLLLALTAACAAELSRRLAGRPARRFAAYRPVPPIGPWLPFAAAAGLATLAPWLALAALGGAAETLGALAAAAALGWLAAVLLGPVWPAYAGGGRWRLAGLGGLVATGFLTLLGAGTGASGVQVLELLVLPPLGFAAAALAGRRVAVAVLVGLAALGPLGFVAPVQTSLQLNLGSRDVGYWALLAAAIALAAGLLAGILYDLVLRRPRPGHRVAGAVAALLVGAGGLAGHVTTGSPGLHGDRLFVVMKQQADLGNLPTGVVARRTEVYRRLVDTANRTQAGLRRDLSRRHLSYTPYYLVNGVEVDAGPAVRAWLASRPDVDRVLLSPRLRPIPAPPQPMRGSAAPGPGPQWNIAMIGADQVWASGDRGQGIVIGTSDTGVDAGHPALAGSFRGGDDSWYDPWQGSRTPTDHNGHGTHTIGSALGRNGIGVAPGAQWMGCVNLDRDMANPAYYLACLQYMLAPYRHGGNPLRDGNPARAADVLTNSWGCPGVEGCDRGALRPAVDALTAAGIFVVAAAGNDGATLTGAARCRSITDPPAPYPDTFTVGAVARDGTVAPFSSRGPVPGANKPDLMAAGVDVLSALPGGGYGRLSGTSMAAPQVAGVVALMWAANPALVGDVARTAGILRATARPVPVDACGDSAGLVDAAAAVRAARAG